MILCVLAQRIEACEGNRAKSENPVFLLSASGYHVDQLWELLRYSSVDISWCFMLFVNTNHQMHGIRSSLKVIGFTLK